MPTASEILAQLTLAASNATAVAVAWHVALALAGLALVLGWRPSHRVAGQVLSAPLASVAILATVFAVRPGGHVIVGTFGPEGPRQCRGLDVARYDADALHAEFGTRFESDRQAAH